MMGAVYSASRRRAAQSGPSPVFSPSFTTGAVPSGATVTRSGTATRVNASGIVESVAANVVRLDYAPATLTARGVLIESSTTNLFGANTDFSLTSTRVGITAATSAVLSPDGSTVAQSLTTATGDCYVGMQSLTNVGQAHTISVYVKRGNCDYIALLLNNSGSTITYFNIATGAVGNVGTDTTAAIEAYPGGWYRISATSAAGDGNYYIQPALRNNGIFDNSQTGDFNYVWGAQVELGGASTSLIMTAATSVARSADTLALTASNGSYDILVGDADGAEWRNAVAVAGGSYPITPRSGKRHVQSVAAYTAGSLTQAQKDALSGGTPPDPLGALVWESTFETTANGGWDEWSYIQAISSNPDDQGPGATYNFVGPAANVGIAAHGGTRVVQFQRLLIGDTQPHAKAFKEWRSVGFSKNDSFGRSLSTISTDVSGSYRAWYYFPSDYLHNNNKASGEWTNILQFKEQGLPSSGAASQQNPSWWLNTAKCSAVGLSGGAQPAVFPWHWSTITTWDIVPIKVPLGQWFELRADLYPGDKIDWYLNGTKWVTSPHSVYPVGRMTFRSDVWIFGVGHYFGEGKFWVDDVSFRRFPT